MASLLACAAASEDRIPLGISGGSGGRGGGSDLPAAAVYVPLQGPDPWALRSTAVRRQADLYGLPVVEGRASADAPSGPPGPRPEILESGEWQSHLLTAAAYEAARRGCDRIVWPVSLGPGNDAKADLVQLALSLDRALLVSRLVGLDQALVGELRVEVLAPYADLSDRQIADLVLDMDLPVWTCWWWGERSSTDHAHPARRAAARWLPVLEAVGWTPRAESPGRTPAAPVVTIPRRSESLRGSSPQ